MNKRLIFCACALATLSLIGCNESKSWKNNAQCGNSIIEVGEVCDATVREGTTCADFDPTKVWNSGKPACSQLCVLTQGTCQEAAASNKCGNGTLDAGEACDGSSFADATLSCEKILGAGATGSVRCVNCAVDTSGCMAPVNCGNGSIDSGEVCDGTNFNGKTCVDYVGEGATGDLSCVKCTAIDSTGCVRQGDNNCGNDVLDDDEVCDGALIDEEARDAFSCPDGYEKGEIKCTSECTFDTAASCHEIVDENCGNGVLDEGEACDGENIAEGASVLCGVGFIPAETLVCIANGCTIDAAQSCIPDPKCGDGVLDEGEVCDGDSISENASVNCPAGTKPAETLVCVAGGCAIDAEKSCVPDDVPEACGNGTLDEGEACDGENIADNASVSCPDGMKPAETLVCVSGGCAIDAEKSCVPAEVPDTCGNSILHDGEGEICDTSLAAYTPIACVYDIHDAGKQIYFTDISNKDAFWMGTNSCSAACDFKSDCKRYTKDELDVTDIVTVMTAKQQDIAALNSVGVTINGIGAVKYNAESGYAAIQFGTFRKAAANGTPDSNAYVQYDLLAADPEIVDKYENIAIFFNYRRNSNSINNMTVALYDGDTLVGVLANFGSEANTWKYSGEIVFSVKGLEKPLVRFSGNGKATDKKPTGGMYLKSLMVRGINPRTNN